MYQPKNISPVCTAWRQILSPLPHPEAVPILERMAAHEPRAVLGQPPVIWHRAEGCQIEDPWGNRWLDWTSGVLVANAGHGRAEVAAVMTEMANRPLHFSYCFPTAERAELADRLAKLAPDGLDKVFFLSTGSEAIEAAIKNARTWQQARDARRNIVVSFTHGYHGRTMGSQLAGGSPSAKQWIAEDQSHFVQVPFPDGFEVMETGFEQFEDCLASQGVPPELVALVLMESYQGGGASFAPVPYVQALRAWCDKHDVLLCMDEVQAGFGRTGRFFAFEHYEICPDLIVCGKAISGSLPLSAVIGRAELLDQYGPGSMTSTHGGHVVACAVALAHLDLILKDKFIERAAIVGETFFKRLCEMAEAYPFVGVVHGRGFVYGLHIVGPDGRSPDPARAQAIVWGCYERGLLMFAPVGVGGGTIKICPPLSTPAEAIDEGIAVLREVLEAMTSVMIEEDVK